MSAFIGDYLCKADSKYRVVVPASFRKVMVSSQQTVFVLRKNVFEACIDMYPYHAWEALVTEVKAKLNPFDRKQATFLRELYRGALEVEMDGNGRVLLPRRILEEIGVDKEMVLVGQDTKIEIWEGGQYEAMAAGGEEFAKLTREIFGE